MNKKPSEYLQEVDSDKTHAKHNYGYIYDILFMSLLFCNQGQPLKVLELGVSRFGIGSGHAFSRMPFVEKFVGVDVSPLCADFSSKGIFIKADAYTEIGIESIKSQGPYNLLIDDASHHPKDQITFFKQYTALCDVPSIMICEDVTKENVPTILETLGDTEIHVILAPERWGENDSNILVRFNL